MDKSCTHCLWHLEQQDWNELMVPLRRVEHLCDLSQVVLCWEQSVVEGPFPLVVLGLEQILQ